MWADLDAEVAQLFTGLSVPTYACVGQGFGGVITKCVGSFATGERRIGRDPEARRRCNDAWRERNRDAEVERHRAYRQRADVRAREHERSSRRAAEKTAARAAERKVA